MTCLISVIPWRSGASLPRQCQRVHVEVLPVEIDALLGEQLVTWSVSQSAGLGVAEVQQSAVLPPSIHSGWFWASQVPPATRSGSNQTMIFMPLAWA